MYFLTPCRSISEMTASKASRFAWMSPRMPYFMKSRADAPSSDLPTLEQRTGHEEHDGCVDRRVQGGQRQITWTHHCTLAEVDLQVQEPEVRDGKAHDLAG